MLDGVYSVHEGRIIPGEGTTMRRLEGLMVTLSCICI